ncbi:MAG: helix-turn-helix transcriptional regulator [Candidatus Omnitrophica bacterium]|jgi:transcriptional regulator with XRE-family HTH domain|nr:helix-turn-helix transcriptional regulator [Candidatus Omnitrophota bacterium]
MQIGEKIKQERVKKKISLREFSRNLGISAAYLVDIEKGRRAPNYELLQKISDLLDIPVSTLNKYNLEMPKHIRDWIEKHPFFSRLFKFALKQPDPFKTIEDLETALPVVSQQVRFAAIYESELQAIGLESSSWETETGGDLFGVWQDIPIIYLATRAGQKAIRNNTHFRLDVEYLIKISSELSNEWGLRYFGDWHSHHKLGLHSPSTGDRERVKRLAEKNNFREMIEFVTTFSNESRKNRVIQIHPFIYSNFPATNPSELSLIVLKGLSPVREALMARKRMPEQQLDSYSIFQIEKIMVPKEQLGRVSGNEGNPQKIISDKVLLNAGIEFRRISSKDIEIHQTEFGYILVVPVRDEQHIAFAVDSNWPHKVLQVDWIDRKTGKSTELDIKDNELSLANLDKIIQCYKLIKENKA